MSLARAPVATQVEPPAVRDGKAEGGVRGDATRIMHGNTGQFHTGRPSAAPAA